MLALCLGVQLLEASGRWDRTFHDANDEAAVVAVVLCIGVGVAGARLLLARIRGSQKTVTPELTLLTVPTSIVRSFIVSIACDSPPLPLRI